MRGRENCLYIKTTVREDLSKANKRNLRFLDGFSFVLGFQSIVAVYVMSSFLAESSGLKRVEIFFFVAYTVSFVILLGLHHLIKKFGKSKVFLCALAIKFMALCGLAFFSVSFAGIFIAIISLVVGPIVWVGLDILVENFSKDQVTGCIRGKFLTIMNAGCLLAPFLSAYLIDRSGDYRLSFLVAAFLVLVVFVVSLFKFSNVNHNIKRDLAIGKVIKKIWKRKNILKIYYISFLMEIFYAVMIVYTPIYLRNLGLEWSQIGLIFTVMLIPFVILQYPAGLIADRKMGEKEMLGAALVITGIATGVMSFFQTEGIVFWMIILFATRVGIALIEVLRDSYFYKRINPEDVDIINFYRTTRSLSYIIAMVVFGGFLIFFDLRWVFLFLALIFLTGLLPLMKLKDSK